MPVNIAPARSWSWSLFDYETRALRAIFLQK